jgi:hypothetical protein
VKVTQVTSKPASVAVISGDSPSGSGPGVVSAIPRPMSISPGLKPTGTSRQPTVRHTQHGICAAKASTADFRPKNRPATKLTLPQIT